jgi:transposase
MPIKQIVGVFGHSRNTIRKVLRQCEPNPVPQIRNRKAPVLGPLHAVIDQMLDDDRNAPPKQRHTAMQVFRRLKDEHGYAGCYGQVRRFIRARRQTQKETFIPLGHLPGQRLEADFGHIHVDFPDGRRLIPFLVTTWAYSNAPFVLALPFERTEAILAGMVAAFEFFGCVPKEVWWDNPKTVATLILVGRQRQLHPRYAALASHYVFDPRFCMPARGQEKPDAESTVKAVQRRFATPVPKVADLAELNAMFRHRCLAERERIVQSLFGPFKIGDRFAEEEATAAPLPNVGFDACVIYPAASVDKYQTVAFDSTRYSVPRPFAFQTVTVKGYVDRVVIVSAGRTIATHRRAPKGSKPVLDPIHYLATLEHKPGALDHTPVYRDWKLPACFASFRAALEALHGAEPGTRRFIQVLQLLSEHPADRVQRAVEACQRDHLTSADAVIARTRSFAAAELRARSTAPVVSDTAGASWVNVPMPDLSRYDEHLNSSAVARGSADNPLTVRADVSSPPGQNSVLFA